MNAVAPIGHNNPPDPIAALTVHADDLYIEVGNWADGTKIENADQAEVVDRLIDDVKAAIKASEDARDAEIAPLNDQVKAVRERYYPLIADTTKLKGRLILMKAALLAVKSDWGRRERERLDAIAAAARQKALDDARAASEAAQAAQGDLSAMEQAEALIRDAKASMGAAKAQTQATPGKGYRTVWNTTMTDPLAAMRWAWASRPEDMKRFVQGLAEAEVREGRRQIPGFDIKDDKVAY